MQKVDLYPHQRKAVDELRNGNILCGGVGTGKSRVAMQYYKEKEAPKDVYVITTAKKRDSLDWEGEAVKHGIGVSRDATLSGVLRVDSWNNLWRYVDVENAFFIFDEQRLVGSGKWVRVFLKIVKRNDWLLLSATPGDTWLDYIPVFVANGWYKNRTEFLREHVVYSRYSKFPKVERFIAVGRLVRYRNSILVDMPYERHTKRHIQHVKVEYDKTLFQKVVKERWHVYENRPLRDVAELFSVMRKVVNSDPSRLESIRMLMEQHPRLIVFYNFDYELEILRSLCGKLTTQVEGLEQSKMSMVSEESNGTSKQISPCIPGITSSSTVVRKAIEKNNKDWHRNQEGGWTNKPGPTSASSTSEPSLSTSESTVTFAEWNGHKHEPIPKTDRWVYLVQYQAGSEAWECTETDVSVFFSLNYSYRIFAQCLGRIDRMNTLYTDLYYYVFKSDSAIDKMIWRALSVKKKFNEPKTEKDLEAQIWKV